jgi:hypothetical protein
VEIIAQLDQAIAHSEELHNMIIQCMAQSRSLSGLSPGNPDGVEEWGNTISPLDGLLQDSGSTLCVIHHKLTLIYITMATCLSSLLTYLTISKWRRIEFTRMRDECYRNNRSWVQRERMNPNYAHHWAMATSAHIATL